MAGWVYCLFESASEGMMLHRRLREVGLEHHICPSPRHLTESCGIALKMSGELVERALEAASELKLRVRVVESN
ncbi:DUF3343 domain-containing protein [Thermanaerovibrio acidaminovorans]|jgi:hypothetical protein|uniref:Putative Se/S carrier protein-like domain-containing protein n=1 Tax=Thermanaerovibrio acidaminovorans (strain ATCC 49978 / DSM 6589 / Su883) TaxID=525903 RepID=D1B887_THEAS|nr:DUF3343 domain-containing protein [Thermanaerovibrio acidaminovorans]ACZ18490.1 hypothetical protein Taci_0252 [Thermanaerovibrio acidaminovorans DSM 6589]